MVRPVDETVLVWNEDVINIAGLLKRASNELMKSASGRNITGLEAKDKQTMVELLGGISKKISEADELYYPATHADVCYLAILADYTHPEIVTAVGQPKDHEPGT